ncbi:MAG: hypothetical protein KDB94_02630 [Acidobacteria bacterium]|nr:hypothetical protein [Acidobacteriota bacterium]MCB9378576.1 hypothetical protein [Holophagales bacterium]
MATRLRDSRGGRRELRRLAGLAHQRELARALAKLESSFALWREGKLEGYELNELIHDYHQGEQREIWGRYKRGHEAPAVARALALGLLQSEELTPQLLEELAGGVDLFRVD